MLSANARTSPPSIAACGLRSALTWQKVRLGAGYISYLHDPVAPEQASDEIRGRVATRESRFLALVRDAVYANPASPHRALLDWAGWNYARLERAVQADGLDSTLRTLRDDGVYSSLAELRRGEPIRRDGVCLATHDARLDVPSARAGIRARTSGTASTPLTVAYDWALFREEAAFEALLFKAHGLLHTPNALWLPALPSISGIHNLLVHLRFRCVPERWFSQMPLPMAHRPAIHYLRAAGRSFGLKLPTPEPVSFEEAAVVARWLAATRDRSGTATLKTFASSAVRLAEAAHRHGIDLNGCVIFTGGEPLTPRRSEYIAATGAKPFARYVATETGWIAAACPHSGSRNAMHVCLDRLAVIEADPGPSNDAVPLLFTTLSRGTNMVFLNTDIGDAGHLSSRSCSCPLGSAGLSLELAAVSGHDKVSAEGMTVPVEILRSSLDDLIAAAGGAPDSYQVSEEHDAHGLSHLVIAISPHVPNIDERSVAQELIRRLPDSGPGAALAARFWKDSSTIQVRRENPTLAPGMKMPTWTVAHRRAAFDPREWMAVHESPDPDPTSQVFRRGVELAHTAVLQVAPRGDRWLEVGSGTGHLAAALARRGLDITAIDADQGMVTSARDRFLTAEALPRLRFVLGDAEQLPIEDESVDGVVATSLIGCLQRGDVFLSEVARVLRPGGTAVITFTNRSSVLHGVGARLNRRRAPSPLSVSARLYSRPQAERLFACAGLELDAVRYYNYFVDVAGRAFPPLSLAKEVERLDGRLGAMFGRNMLVRVSKSPVAG